MALKRFLFVSDSHGDQIDPKAEKAVLDFIEEFNPHYRIHGGDFLDLRPLRKGASADERAERLVDDVDAGIEFLEKYFDGGGKKVLLLGNHDDRLWELAESSTEGVQATYANALIGDLEKKFRELRLEVLPYDVRKGVFELGNLSFVHGYRCNEHVAKSHAIEFGSVIFGHVHRFSSATVPQRRPSVGMSCGCLAKTDMPYLHRSIASLAHQNGFYFGAVDEKTGDWEAWPVKRVGERWMNPRGI